MYWYCASSTCTLACAVRARRAKMSRMRSLRSMTFYFELFLDVGDLGAGKLIVENNEADVFPHHILPYFPPALPLPMNVALSGCGSR